METILIKKLQVDRKIQACFLTEIIRLNYIRGWTGVVTVFREEGSQERPSVKRMLQWKSST
jgi:hypothetical protein